MDLKRTMLWSPTLGDAPYEARVRAAAENDYPMLTVSPVDVHAAIERGLEPSELSRWARDLGVESSIMDGFADWYPHRIPKYSPMPPFDRDEFLALAVAFGAAAVVLVAPFATEAGFDEVIEGFAAFCDRAALDGLAVNLEFTPIAPVGSVELAHRVLREAGRPNTGMIFDCWHFFQGTPDFDALAAVPAGMIAGTQISGGFMGTFTEGLVKDTFRHRLLPGEGDFEIERVLQVLDDKGALAVCGPEVLSTELFAMTPTAAAATAAAAYDALASRLRN
ncbi:MAG: sugar phosphate isomerase/epimerase family protein [Acidimicrobiia bacterium]